MTSNDLSRARQVLPLPALMHRIGDGAHAKKSAHCGWRRDLHPSLSVFPHNGRWFWKDHGTGESGDEITYLEKRLGLTRRAAIRTYINLSKGVS